MQTIDALISVDPQAIPLLSLDSRISLLRRPRRNSVLKQLLVVTAPVIIGVTLILLVAAAGVVASAR